MRRMHLVVFVFLFAVTLSGPVAAQQGFERDTVRMWIPAVGQREDGSLFGVASALEVTMQRPGTGEVFLSTQPLTQIDMQGSARLAVDTAAAVTGRSATGSDFFFSVRTPSITIGGPSAGGAMSVAVTALLMDWDVREDVVMTGMINPDGSIGPIGGVFQKLEAADSVDAKRFLVPLGQATVAGQDSQGRSVVIDLRDVGRDQYGIQVEEVADLFDAVGPFTGFDLIRPAPSTDPLLNQAYGEITTRLADNLTAEVERRVTELDQRGQAVQGGNDAQAIQQQLQLAHTRLDQAKDAQTSSKQYLASSLAFQGLVALDYAEALIAFHEGQEGASTYLSRYLSTTDTMLRDVGNAIPAPDPLPVSRLDVQAGAEQRVVEAEAAQAAARQLAQQGNVASALQSSSFARERAESGRWWYRIGEEIASAGSDGATVGTDALRALIGRYRETAELELAYASLIVPEGGDLDAAQASYHASQKAETRGFLAGSLLELIETVAQTSTALVSLAGDEPVRQRLSDLSDSAAYQIELAGAGGSPPVYAIALLELADSRAQDDPVGAYASYSMARITARAALQAAGATIPPAEFERSPRPGFGSFDSPLVFFVLLAGSSALVLLVIWGVNARAGYEAVRRDARRGEPAAPGPIPQWLPEPSPPPPLAELELPPPRLGLEAWPDEPSITPILPPLPAEPAEPPEPREEPKPKRKPRPTRPPAKRATTGRRKRPPPREPQE